MADGAMMCSTAHIKAVGRHIGCDEVLSDNAGNVVLRKKGTQGYEDSPSVCFQAHMDMVRDSFVH
jgi:putative aminopeptidase FrvX